MEQILSLMIYPTQRSRSIRGHTLEWETQTPINRRYLRQPLHLKLSQIECFLVWEQLNRCMPSRESALSLKSPSLPRFFAHHTKIQISLATRTRLTQPYSRRPKAASRRPARETREHFSQKLSITLTALSMALMRRSIIPQPPDKKINGRALSLRDPLLRKVTAKNCDV